jgi:uncharacterized membrane protein
MQAILNDRKAKRQRRRLRNKEKHPEKKEQYLQFFLTEFDSEGNPVHAQPSDDDSDDCSSSSSIDSKEELRDRETESNVQKAGERQNRSWRVRNKKKIDPPGEAQNCLFIYLYFNLFLFIYLFIF